MGALKGWLSEVRWALQGIKLAASPKREVHVWSIAGGLGDELMALGAVQAFANRRTSSVSFHVRNLDLMTSACGTLVLKRYDPAKLPSSSIALYYLKSHKLSVIAQMCRQLGVRPEEFPIDLPSRCQHDLPPGYPTDGQRVVIQTTASDWTPNKQWPEEYWRRLVDLIPESVRIIEVGRESIFATPPARKGYVSLVGNTSLVQFAACIQEADAFVGPISGGMHLAHAYKVPSVIIIGGYEEKHPYPLANQFYSQVPCAPCWLRTPCPHTLKCLRAIQPASVNEAILAALKTRTSPTGSMMHL